MFLQLNHAKLTVFSSSKELVIICYKLTAQFPVEEKYALVQQIRRAVTSVHLNIAEGASRKSNIERKRFYEIARGSLIEVDTAIDIAFNLDYCTEENLKPLGDSIIGTFKLLSGLINSQT